MWGRQGLKKLSAQWGLPFSSAFRPQYEEP